MSPWLLLLGVAGSSTVTEGLVRRVMAGLDVLPSLECVQDAAEARLDETDRSNNLATRARWRGLVPSLDASLGTDAGLDVRDSESAARTTTDSRGFGARVSLRFELGDLVYSESEVRAERAALARAASARLVRERVTELYFKRVEVLLEQIQLRKQPSKGERDEKRLAELALEAARLDGRIKALTGPIRRKPHPTFGGSP